MSHPFRTETVQSVTRVQEKSALKQIDNHELLRSDENDEQVIGFDQVLQFGRWFLNYDNQLTKEIDGRLPLDKIKPMLDRYAARQSGPFLAKIIFGQGAENHWPATVEVVRLPDGRYDLKMHIVSVHYGALEVAKNTNTTDGFVALAAAAAAAPHFSLALTDGVSTTHCATKKEIVTGIKPDHGGPLGVLFDSFDNKTNTLQSITGATKDSNLTIKSGSHLHGMTTPTTNHIVRAAGASKVAAGVVIHPKFRSDADLPFHTLRIPTRVNEQGKTEIISLQEAISEAGLAGLELSLLAVALGFTSQVIDNTKNELLVEKLFDPKHAETPLRNLVSS